MSDKSQSKGLIRRVLLFVFLVALAGLIVFNLLAFNRRRTFEQQYVTLTEKLSLQQKRTKELRDYEAKYTKFDADRRLMNFALCDIYTNCSSEEFSPTVSDEFTVRPASFGRFALNNQQRRQIAERLWNEKGEIGPKRSRESPILESHFHVPETGNHRLTVDVLRTHFGRLQHSGAIGKRNVEYSKTFQLERGKQYKAVFDPALAGDSATLSVTGCPDQQILFQKERIDCRVATMTGADDRAHWSPSQFGHDYLYGQVEFPIASIAYGRSGKDVEFEHTSIKLKAMYLVQFRLVSDGPVTAAADDPIAIREAWKKFNQRT